MTNQSRNRDARAFALRTIAVLSIAFVTAMLAACGSKPESAPPPPVEDTAFGDMAGAMDRARAVEDSLQEHKEALDRTLQQNENPNAE